MIQSFRTHNVPHWIARCVESVTRWATHLGYRYEFVDDALLDRVPDWYREKVRAKTPLVTDLARLLWIREKLAQGGVDVVAWLDADTLVFAPNDLEIEVVGSCVFGYEYWLQQNRHGKPVVRNNVHNAYCAFRPNCPVLPFLIESIERLVSQIDPDFIAPQFVGPKLLTSLHNTVGFNVDPRFGAVSPDLSERVLGGHDGSILGERVSKMRAANLCLTLSDEIEHELLISNLQRFDSGL